MKELILTRCLFIASLVTATCMPQHVTEAFIDAVPLQDVKLEHNSQYDKALSLNKEYILGIETDSLLKSFRCHFLQYLASSKLDLS